MNGSTATRKQVPFLETIQIIIGMDSATWHICDTRAPADYDGFGTFAVHEIDDDPPKAGHAGQKPMRTVLIRDDHVEWQRARYASGNYGPGEVSGHRSATELTAEFWMKIRKSGELWNADGEIVGSPTKFICRARSELAALDICISHNAEING